MREAFKRSVELLDIEVSGENELETQKQSIHEKVEQMTPEQVQELLRILGSCNASGSSLAMRQRSSSTKDGHTSGYCLAEKSSSKGLSGNTDLLEPTRSTNTVFTNPFSPTEIVLLGYLFAMTEVLRLLLP